MAYTIIATSRNGEVVFEKSFDDARSASRMVDIIQREGQKASVLGPDGLPIYIYELIRAAAVEDRRERPAQS